MDANLQLAGLPMGMVQLEMVLPSQHFASRRMRAPEQDLMAAVLQDALDCVNQHRFAKDAHRRRLFDEAEHWFLADEADWPYSFECICGALDLDSDAVREHLRLGRGGQPVHEIGRPVFRQGASQH